MISPAHCNEIIILCAIAFYEYDQGQSVSKYFIITIIVVITMIIAMKQSVDVQLRDRSTCGELCGRRCNSIIIIYISSIVSIFSIVKTLKMAIILPTGQWYAPSAVINDVWNYMV